MAYAPFYDGDYSYYTIMRIIVCLMACYFGFITKDGDGYFADTDSKYPLMFLFIAILFNPIIPIHLEKSIWAPIDIIAAAAWVFYFIERKVSHRKSASTKKTEQKNDNIEPNRREITYQDNPKEDLIRISNVANAITLAKRTVNEYDCVGIEIYRAFLAENAKNINDVINRFTSILYDSNIMLYEYEIDVGQDTFPSKAKYITESKDLELKGKSFLYETINQRNYQVNFYVRPGMNNWISYFFFQAEMDYYSNAYQYPEYYAYKVVVEAGKISNLKAQLNATEHLKYMPFINNDYPYLLFENEDMKIQAFIEDHDGFKLITAKIELRVHFQITETLLVEKGSTYGMLY